MRHHEFIDRVFKRADLDSRDEADRATEATLSTFGERIYRTERDNLAAQLPDPLKRYLRKRVDPGATERDIEHFTLEEFYDRVGARAGVRYTPAVERTQAVMSVLQEAATQGILDDIFSKLPNEYDQLLAQQPQMRGEPSAV